MLPSGVQVGDRYIGIEVSFPAELDEYFQVRNVKRGAEPVSRLRDELRRWVRRPVLRARKAIRLHWNEVEVAERNESGGGRSSSVGAAVDSAEQDAPKGQAGQNVTPEQEARVVNDILEDLEIDAELDPSHAEEVRGRIRTQPLTILDASWPGRELMDIEHLNGRAVLKLNHRHPFIREIYDPIREIAGGAIDDQDSEKMYDLLQRTSVALDLLFLSYAKAENLHVDTDPFESLRSYWGQHLQAYLKELAKIEG